jgi:hypothetical protein
VPRRLALVFLALALTASAQSPAIFPLSEVQPGQHGVGRTVFSGTKVEEFEVEILGVLENVGPRQSVILARLSGGPLEKTGVLQGMSGSPVTINGRLVGAIALAFPFSKEPIAGIRPIEEMLRAEPARPPAAAHLNPFEYGAELPARASLQAGSDRLLEIATPLWLGGFTRSTLDHFAPQLRAAGFEPVQGVSGGASPEASNQSASPGKLEPGAMISVELLTGDLSAGADGTVTLVAGSRVYAFGHRFIGAGDTELPFARADVITLLASLNSSFKISSTREWLGTILSDRSTSISGLLGRRAPMIPVSVRLRSAGRESRYRFDLVRDRLLTPLLAQMAFYSIIDATERVSGPATIQATGRIDLDGAAAVRLDNAWSAESGVAQIASSALVAPVAAIATSGFPALTVRAIDLDLEISNDRRDLRLDTVWTSRREVHPGDSFEIFARFTGESGLEIERSASYNVPVGASIGPLSITVSDASTANLAEYRQFITVPPRNAVQLVDFLNGLRTSRQAWVRISRPSPSWTVQGETLPDLPASMTLLFGRSTLAQFPGARIAEIPLAAPDFVFTGSKTVLVDVKD